MLNARSLRKAAKVITRDGIERSERQAARYLEAHAELGSDGIIDNAHNAQTEFGAASVARFVDNALSGMRVSTAAELKLKMTILTTQVMLHLDDLSHAQSDGPTAAIYRCMFNEARYLRQQIQELKANEFQ